MRSAVAVAVLMGCSEEPVPDEAERYLDDMAYRRQVLEGTLEHGDNDYGRQRFAQYAVPGSTWEELPEADPSSRPLTASDRQALADGESPDPGGTPTLPDVLPSDEDGWIALGERVFFEYPLRIDPVWTAVAGIPDGLEQVGVLERDGAWVGLRVVDAGGVRAVGLTCALCHGSDALGALTGQLSNRGLDVGLARVLAGGIGSVPELESSDEADLLRLGPGRADVLPDGAFDPYAFPDFGGLVDQPRLQHNGNWAHGDTSTLAVRCETLFITSTGARTRPPRALVWALASYLRSLPPIPPTALPDDASERGSGVFDAAGCAACHTPPTYTSDQVVPVDRIGTDPTAATSPSRTSPGYRVPSLRGVGHAAPYLHHGALPSLEAMFDPGREQPGHPFGLELDDGDRADLLAFLRTL